MTQHAGKPVHRLWCPVRRHEPATNRVHAEPTDGISRHAARRDGHEQLEHGHASSADGNAIGNGEDAVSADRDAVHGHAGDANGRDAADDDGYAAATSANGHVQFQRDEHGQQWFLEFGYGHVVQPNRRKRRTGKLLVLERSAAAIVSRRRNGIENDAPDDGVSRRWDGCLDGSANGDAS